MRKKAENLDRALAVSRPPRAKRATRPKAKEELPALYLKVLLSGRRRPSEVVKERGAEALDDPEVISALKKLSAAAREDLEAAEAFAVDDAWGGSNDRGFTEAARKEITATCNALRNRSKSKQPRGAKDPRISARVEALIKEAGSTRKAAEIQTYKEFGVTRDAVRGAYSRRRLHKN